MSGPILPPFERYRNLLDPILDRCERQPQQESIVLCADDGSQQILAIGDLIDAARRRAAALEAAGVGKRDVVILVIGHSTELIGSFLAALLHGAVPAIFPYLNEKLDPTIYGERVRALVEGAGARAVVTGSEFRSQMTDLLDGVRCDVIGAADLTASASEPITSERSSASLADVAYLQYTSGTSGLQKGVPQTHGALLRYIEAGLPVDPFTPEDVIVSWLPLYHDLGLVTGLLIPLVLGVRSVLMSPFRWVRNPQSLFRAVHDFRGTMCWMPNFALNHCVQGVRERDLEGIDLRHWKSLICGGETVRLDSQQRFLDCFRPFGFRDTTLQSGYGMAENVCAATTTDRNAPPIVDWVDVADMERRQRATRVAAESPGSMPMVSSGRAFPGTEVRIVGADETELGDRMVGEILLRGRYLFTGYYNRPDLTSKALRGGWFHTGDLGYTVDGQLYVYGRKSDVIIVGGRNIYPDDLEAMIGTIDGVAAGRVVAFGVPDERGGTDRVVVVCESRASADPSVLGEIEKLVRRRAQQELDVTVSDVRLVTKGWVLKTSNGKIAHAANREKYLRECGNPWERRQAPPADRA